MKMQSVRPMGAFVTFLVSVFTLIDCTLGATPCCMPDQWSANLVQSIGEYNQDLDSASLAYGNSDYFYDFVGNQTAYRQKLDNQTAHEKVDSWVITKYETGKKYVIQNGKCSTLDFDGKILPKCIPDDATSLGTHFYPSMTKVDFWIYADKDTGETRRIGVSQGGCLPMTMSGLTKGPDFLLTMDLFQNVTKGITDPSVFDIPSICKQVK